MPRLAHTRAMAAFAPALTPMLGTPPARVFAATNMLVESGVSYGIDFLTALPPSGPFRYTWCMVVKDHFSGYTHILPCSENITAEQLVTCGMTCAAMPCQNGGICQNFGSNYMYMCQVGFTGANCEAAGH